jgi:hypothetical protein
VDANEEKRIVWTLILCFMALVKISYELTKLWYSDGQVFIITKTYHGYGLNFVAFRPLSNKTSLALTI